MNLLQLSKKIKNFFKLKFIDKVLIIKVIFMSAIARFIMLVIPFKYIKNTLGYVKEESEYKPNKEEINYIRRINWAINTVCKNTPWESKCLVQAIIAQKLLVSKNIESTFYLGVGKKNKDMIAHAWVVCGDYYVSGWSNEKYGIVAKFRK